MTDVNLPPEPGLVSDPDLGVESGDWEGSPPADEPDEPTEVNDDEETEDDDGDEDEA